MAVSSSAAATTVAITGILKDVKDNFPKAVYKAGFMACAASVAAAAAAVKEGELRPGVMGIHAGTFAGGVGAMYSGVWLDAAGVHLAAAAKSAIFGLASLPLVVAGGISGTNFCKNILGAL